MRMAAWLVLLAVAGCRPEAKPPAPSAAAAKVVKEGDLQTVTLSAEAETRLGIQVAPVEVRKVERTRMLGGIATAIPGSRVTVTAPLAGTLSAATPPAAGRKVAKGQAVFSLAPILAPEARASLASSRVAAEGDAKTSTAELQAAKVALGRAELLLKEKAGAQKAVDEGKARVEAAQASLKAAEARREVLAGAEAGTLGALPIVAPFEGVLLDLHAAAGQAVPAGAPLFDVADVVRLWVRVPLYAGDVRTIDLAREALVNGTPAQPAAGPPSADAGTATVDLYYELAGAAVRPGENVAVTLVLAGEAESKVVPHGAILHDVHGGTWVYERTKPLTYVRRRVQVAHVTGGSAVLKEGPDAGAPVVAVGAAEIFGTEFFVSK